VTRSESLYVLILCRGVVSGNVIVDDEADDDKDVTMTDIEVRELLTMKLAR